MDKLKQLDLVSALVALPPILGAIAWLAAQVFAGVTGTHPIWNLQPRNLAEAAAFEDSGALVRLVNAGEDPDDPAEVRAGVLGAAPATLAPIEAAAETREFTTVQLLLDLGASPGADAWRRAWCASDVESVRDLLAAHRPEGASEACIVEEP